MFVLRLYTPTIRSPYNEKERPTTCAGTALVYTMLHLNIWRILTVILSDAMLFINKLGVKLEGLFSRILLKFRPTHCMYYV